MKEMSAEIDKAAVVSALTGNTYTCVQLAREYTKPGGGLERETIIVDGRGMGSRVKLTIRREDILPPAPEESAKPSEVVQ